MHGCPGAGWPNANITQLGLRPPCSLKTESRTGSRFKLGARARCGRANSGLDVRRDQGRIDPEHAQARASAHCGHLGRNAGVVAAINLDHEPARGSSGIDDEAAMTSSLRKPTPSWLPLSRAQSFCSDSVGWRRRS